jgi:hypothetical protein
LTIHPMVTRCRNDIHRPQDIHRWYGSV